MENTNTQNQETAVAETEYVAPEYKGFAKKLDNYFEITARKSTIRTEIIAGLTTFFALCYIVVVNPNQVAAEGSNGWLAQIFPALSGSLGQIWNSAYVGSILVAVIGTLLMAFVAKLPFAQACGMGLNSFFCTLFVSGAAFAGADVVEGYQAGLVVILLSGIIFLVLSATGARQYIAKAMPDCLKKAIPAGIGLFIAFIGLKNAGLVVANQYTFVAFADFKGMTEWAQAVPVIIAFIGVMLIAIFNKSKINWLRKGSIILAILASAILYYLLTWTVPSLDFHNLGTQFVDWASIGVVGIFKGSSWATAFTAEYIGGIFSALMIIVAFCLVDMFDTIGTLYGTAAQANMLDEHGDPINVNKAMLSDSIATCVGAVVGTSTCTTFVESASGVAEGGRTGLTSVVTAACLLLCLFVSPLASVIPSAATASALIYVGVLMSKNFAKVDMTDVASAVPAFLALVMMPLTYSISNGIGIASIAYVIITLCTGKYTKKDIVVTIIAILFILKFAFVTM